MPDFRPALEVSSNGRLDDLISLNKKADETIVARFGGGTSSHAARPCNSRYTARAMPYRTDGTQRRP